MLREIAELRLTVWQGERELNSLHAIVGESFSQSPEKSGERSTSRHSVGDREGEEEEEEGLRERYKEQELELKNLKENFNFWEQELERLKTEYENRSAELATANEKIKALGGERDLLAEEVASKTSSLKLFQELFDKQKSEVDQVQEDVSKFQEAEKLAAETIRQLTDENLDLKKAISFMEREKENSNLGSPRRLADENKTLKEKLASLEMAASEQQTKFEKIISERDKLTEENEKLRSEQMGGLYNSGNFFSSERGLIDLASRSPGANISLVSPSLLSPSSPNVTSQMFSSLSMRMGALARDESRLAALIQDLNSLSIPTKISALATICSLAASAASAIPILAKHGVVTAIIRCLSEKDPKLLEGALAALTNLATDMAIKKDFARLQGLKFIHRALSSKIRDVQYQACGALWSLSLNCDENKMLPVETLGFLIEILKTFDDPLRAQAAGALGNVCAGIKENKVNVGVLGGVEALTACLGSTNELLVSQAAVCLGNLSLGTKKNNKRLRKAGSTVALATAATRVKPESPIVQDINAVFLRLASKREQRRLIEQGGVQRMTSAPAAAGLPDENELDGVPVAADVATLPPQSRVQYGQA